MNLTTRSALPAEAFQRRARGTAEAPAPLESLLWRSESGLALAVVVGAVLAGLLMIGVA